MPNNPRPPLDAGSVGSSRSGLERAAMVMMSLGEDEAAAVCKRLNARSVQQLGAAMAGLKHVTRDEVLDALEALKHDAEQCMAVSLGSDDYIRTVLTKALGADRAGELMGDIMDAGDANEGIEALNWLPADTVIEIIGNEHPQIIATILVHLQRDRAAGVLALLPERLRNDVTLRIATFGGVQPAVLAELTDALDSLLVGHTKRHKDLGGVRTAAEILNAMPGNHEQALLETLRERDAELTQKIIDEMFIFESLLDVEDAGIQLLLKELDQDSLRIALKGVPDALRDKFLRNMSSRAADMLREDLQAQGPVRASRVEAEQKKIVQIARRLAESGQIVLNAQGDDAYV